MRCLIGIDDIQLCNTIEGYLSKIDSFSYIKRASNLESAKGYLQNHEFDFMITHCQLENDINHNILAWIRHNNIDVEVIFITDNISLECIQRAFRLGVCDYLLLPFTFDRFHLAIKRVVEKILFMNSQNQFTQREIDDYIAIGALNHIAKASTTKGISTSTLKKIESSLETTTKYFTSAQIADKTGLSRITVRRYLENMVDSDQLQSFFEYGKVGRPHKLYAKKKDEQ